MNDELILTCSCSHLHHTVRFSWNVADAAAYVEVSLCYEASWWTRLKVAWRYLWRDVCGYGDVAEVIVKAKDLETIRAWADARTKTFESAP